MQTFSKSRAELELHKEETSYVVSYRRKGFDGKVKQTGPARRLVAKIIKIHKGGEQRKYEWRQ